MLTNKIIQNCPETSKNAGNVFKNLDISRTFGNWPNACQRIRMHPNEYECVSTGARKSELVQKLRKTCATFETFAQKLLEIVIFRYLWGAAITSKVVDCH